MGLPPAIIINTLTSSSPSCQFPSAREISQLDSDGGVGSPHPLRGLKKKVTILQWQREQNQVQQVENLLSESTEVRANDKRGL